jgi:hypothetical protein
MGNFIDPRKLSRVYRFTFLLSGGLAFAGEYFSFPVLTNLALLCIGLLITAVGVELIVTKRAAFRIGGWAYTQARETYKGLAAQLWGIMFLGLGLMAIVLALAKWMFPAAAHSFYSNLVGTPAGAGLALTFLGLMAILYGTIRVLAGSAGVDLGRLTGLSNLLDRMAGAVICVVGLGLASFGILLIIAPSIVFMMIAQVKLRILHWL